jgi:hypothetical protein
MKLSMESDNPQMPKTLRRLIAGLELIGGTCGLVLLAKQLPYFRVDAHVIILAPIAISIFLMSLVAGALLWRGHRAGRIASIIVQMIQLPKLASPLLIFMFSFGFDFYPYIAVARGVSNVEVDFKLLAFYNLYLNRPGFPFAFGISIPAAVFLIMLFRYKPRGTLEKMMPPPPPPPTGSDKLHALFAPLFHPR